MVSLVFVSYLAVIVFPHSCIFIYLFIYLSFFDAVCDLFLFLSLSLSLSLSLILSCFILYFNTANVYYPYLRCVFFLSVSCLIFPVCYLFYLDFFSHPEHQVKILTCSVSLTIFYLIYLLSHLQHSVKLLTFLICHYLLPYLIYIYFTPPSS